MLKKIGAITVSLLTPVLFLQADDPATANVATRHLEPGVLPTGTSITVDLGKLDQTPYITTIAGNVNKTISKNTYTFRLQSTCDFAFSLYDLTSDANAFLLNAAGITIQASKNKLTTPEKIQARLLPGDYSLVVQNRTSSGTNYHADFSAVFVPEDVVVSGNIDLHDPEFDTIYNHVAWRTPDGLLMVAQVDPTNGFFDLAGEKILDSTLTLSSEVLNGPEWAYSDTGSRILYTKNIPGTTCLGQASLGPQESWLLGIVPNTNDGKKPVGSTWGPDANPLVKYVSGKGERKRTLWRDLDNPALGGLVGDGLVADEGGRWGQGDRLLYLSRLIADSYQIFTYNVDNGIFNQLTTGSLQKIGPFPIRAPEFGGETVVISLDSDDPAVPYSKWINVYRYSPVTNFWELIKTIPSPAANLPIVESSEPFVFAGKSYVSFVVTPLTGGNKGAEVWIASLAPGDNFVRRVSLPSSNASLSDPEFFTAPGTTFIYYTDTTLPQGVIHRLTTGLLPN